MSAGVVADARQVSAQADDLDQLLDYDTAVADFLKDIPGGNPQPVTNSATAQTFDHDEDQEVKIKKTRKPVAKLDEDKLLSNEGITKLRKIAKTKLKLRGKGHEIKDMSRILNMYQLWLDDLYPRANFRDALTMVEKVGHRKRMQVMRKAWLDETKLGKSNETAGQEWNGDHARAVTDDTANDPIFPSDEAASNSNDQDVPPDDELDQLLADESSLPVRSEPTSRHPGPFEDDVPDDDDLDAMLAEEAMRQPTQTSDKARPARPFLDDMPDDDDLDALLAEHE